MGIRIGIAALVFMMVQAVLFGVGVVLVLATPLSELAMTLMPWVVGVSTVIALPLSWFIAPRLRLRYWRERGQLPGSQPPVQPHVPHAALRR
ncbi:hypothetical protein [Azospirillum sp.]|uniref:hypothetical protein n=1 Tax=Azospirillum sp. TaxID=34012 RepID=UPI003D726643